MSASARLVVQMPPSEKQALDQRARNSGLTTSEFVRRRITEDEGEDSREEIEALLSALEASAPAILKSLDATIAETAALKATIDKLNLTASS